MNQNYLLNRENAINDWFLWLKNHPKDFLETFGLVTGTLVTAVVAVLTFRLFQLNKATLEANSRQSNQNILGLMFEDGMLTVEKTMSALTTINVGIQTAGDFYPSQYAPRHEDTKAQKESAQKFGLRLDLYGVTKVSTEYKNWLQAMLDFLTMLQDIQDSGNMDSYGSVHITDTERAKYAPRFHELLQILTNQKEKIMFEMNELVSIN